MVDSQPGMDALFNSLPALVGLGAGLACFSGLRAFLPLAIVALVSRLDAFGPLELAGTPFAFLENPWVIALLIVLALVEIAVDKMPLLESVQDFVSTPLRVLAGAVLFGAALGHEPAWVIALSMVAGAVISGAAHVGKSAVRPAATVSAAGTINPYLSLLEDLTALVGTILVLLVPLLGYLVLLFLLFLLYRVSRRRRRKYRGLRILRD